MPPESTPSKVSDIDLVFLGRRSLVGVSGVERWAVRAVLGGGEEGSEGGPHDSASRPDELVGSIELLVVDLTRCRDPWGELDASNDEVAHIGETVFDVNTGQLAEEFDSRLRRIGERVVVVDYVELAPAWRGHNVASLLVAECLDQLRADCRVAVCLPGPLGRRDLAGDAYDEAVRRMQAVWAQAGFAPYQDGVWFLDPHTGTLPASLARLRTQHGLP